MLDPEYCIDPAMSLRPLVVLCRGGPGTRREETCHGEAKIESS